TSIRRGLAAAHGHELFLTKSENEPCGLIETVCELSVVRIHHLSSFRLRRRSQRRDYLQTRHTKCSFPSKTRGANFFGMMAQSVGVSVALSVSLSTILVTRWSGPPISPPETPHNRCCARL